MGRRKKRQDWQSKLVFSILFLIAVIGGYVYQTQFHNDKPTSVARQIVSDEIQIQQEGLNVIYFDVGQADCELLISQGKTMLIDAGNQADGILIADTLKQLQINKIDYLIGTHPHEDHIGGMKTIVEQFEIGTIYMPYQTQAISKVYTNLTQAILEKDLQVETVEVGDQFQVGEANCEVMAVDNTEPENLNLSSIVIQANFKNKKYLFMGDSETKNEKARAWEKVNVLKVGHHGSDTSSSEQFLKQVSPDIAIISVGKDNQYHLPKETILKRIQNLGSTIYRTDQDGTIQITTDGTTDQITKIRLSLDGDK